MTYAFTLLTGLFIGAVEAVRDWRAARVVVKTQKRLISAKVERIEHQIDDVARRHAEWERRWA